MQHRDNSIVAERKQHPVAAVISVLAVAVGAALAIPSSSGAAPAGIVAPDADAAATTAWCGNGCSSSQEDGIKCTDWTPGTGSSSQTCQAKAACTGDDCNVWPTDKSPSGVRDILANHRNFTAERYSNGHGYGVILTPND